MMVCAQRAKSQIKNFSGILSLKTQGAARQ
jgi:hypothetical protein